MSNAFLYIPPEVGPWTDPDTGRTYKPGLPKFDVSDSDQLAVVNRAIAAGAGFDVSTLVSALIQIAWANVTGKPSSFTPSAHTHAAGDVVSGQFANARISEASVTQYQGALALAIAQVAGLQAALDALIPASEKGAANGVATLDANTLLPLALIPNLSADQTTSGTFDAARIPDLDWSKIIEATRPDTLAGYGITDALTSTQVGQQIQTAIDNLVGGAPGALDTLNELAAALGDDPNAITALTNTVATKLDASLWQAATAAVDGFMSKEDKAKLDGIEAGATGDQTGAEIKALYEGEADTNAFTDAEKSKLAGVAAQATKNATDAALRDRSTHTGEQPQSSVTNLVQDLADRLLRSELPFASVAQYSSTNTSTDLAAGAVIRWNSAVITDSAISVGGTDSDEITVAEAGLYRVAARLSYEDTSADGVDVDNSIGVTITVNGVGVGRQAPGSPVVNQNGQNEGSAFIEEVLNLDTNDVVRVTTQRLSGGDEIYLRSGESSLIVERKGGKSAALSAQKFKDLTDTPSDYSGLDGQFLRIKTGGGVEATDEIPQSSVADGPRTISSLWTYDGDIGFSLKNSNYTGPGTRELRWGQFGGSGDHLRVVPYENGVWQWASDLVYNFAAGRWEVNNLHTEGGAAYWHAGNFDPNSKASSGHVHVADINPDTSYDQTPIGVNAIQTAGGLWPFELSAGLQVTHSQFRQFQVTVGNDGLAFRRGHSSNTGGVGTGWSPWRKVWHEGNLNPESLGGGVSVAAIQTSAFTPAVGTAYPVKGGVTLTALPATTSQGERFWLYDPDFSWGASAPMTLPGADKINGRTENQLVSAAGGYVEMEYVDSSIGWKMTVFQVDGRFAYSSPFVDTPSVTSPAEGSTTGPQPTIIASAFSVTNGSDTHFDTDWQVATDTGFTNVVAQSLADTSNKTSWSIPFGSALSDGVHYARVRYNGASYGDSEWSPAISFTAAGYAYVNAEASSFEAAATQVNWDDTLRGDIDQLFSDLKSGQINATDTLSRLDFLFLHDLPNGDDARLDIKSATLTATAVNSPTHTATEGFTFDGSSSYLNTGWNPSTDASQYALNGGGVGAWLRTLPSSTPFQCLIGAQKTGGSDAFTQILLSNKKLEFSGLQGSATTGLLSYASEATGLFYIQRTTPAAIEAFVNNSSQSTGTQASTNLTPLDFYIGARNGNGTATAFSTAQISLTFACADLTANERADLYDALNRYRAAREAA